MAKNVGMSHSSIGRIWRAFGLQPHRTETVRLSQDPLLIEKVRDIVGLYMSPPANAVVLCIDEKSQQIQALERAQPMDFGRPERRTPDYIRHGTTDLFGCHAPPSAAKELLSRREVGKIVDQALALSRATLVRDLRGVLRRCAQDSGDPEGLSRVSLGR